MSKWWLCVVGGKCIKKGYILGHHGGLRCWLPLCLSKFLLLTYVRCSHNVFISDAGRRRLMMIIIIRRRPPCTTPRVYIARNRNRWGSPYFTQERYINAIILVMCHYLSCGFTWTELQEYLFIYLLAVYSFYLELSCIPMLSLILPFVRNVF